MERFLSFAGIGAVATSIHCLILVAGVQLATLDPVLASTVGFVTAALANYLLNRRYTFHSKKPHPEAITKFFSVALVGLVLNGMLLAAGTELLGLNYLFSQVIASAVVLVWNYFANATWTFAEGRRTIP